VPFVVAADARVFLDQLDDASVDLFLIDPPYFAVRDLWDHDWKTADEYSAWLVALCDVARRKVKPKGSLIMFNGIGRHGEHPIFDVIRGLERGGWCFRNWITWKRSRAFGKSDNYLFGRDEIVWFSASAKPREITFNTPFLDEKPKKPGKTEFLKATNVWDDIQPVFRPTRECQRPLPLIARLIRSHSNEGELVSDFFSGSGTTGIVSHNLRRRFLGCEQNESDAEAANRRVKAARRA
jgi:DNA modification methylase